MVEVIAAIENRQKNRVPKRAPPGILEKMRGRTLKTSPGPAVGAIPGMAKSVGKMMTPAKKAMRESKKHTCLLYTSPSPRDRS